VQKNLSFIVGGIALLAVAGCGGSADTILGIEDNPRVRVLNLVQDSGTVDIEFDRNEVLTDSTFGDTSSRRIYQNGNRRIIVRDSTTSGVLVDQENLYELSNYYTTVAYSDEGTVRIARIVDDQTVGEPVAQIRVLNFDDESDNVDVYITAPGAPITGSTPTVSDLAFADVATTGAGYNEFAPGTYQVRVTAPDSTVPLASQNVTVQSFGSVTLYFTRQGVAPELRILDDKQDAE
jgi:hypothetical protein